MKILNIEQGSPEWLALRKNKIGASDAPVLMEVSPWRTPYQLWSEKMGLSETEQNQSMRRGLELEPIARQKFVDEIGYGVSPVVALHDSISYMLASFDGLSDSGEIAVEIKCPGREDHEMAMDGIITEKYVPQLQHQMEVADIDSMFYFSYSERSYKIIEINRDHKYIKDIIEKEKAFWDCMQNLEAPDLIDRDYIKMENPEWDELEKEWMYLSQFENRKEQVRKRLIEIAQNKNARGNYIKLSKVMRKGNVDYKSVPALTGIDLEKYRKGTIETYRIGVC